MFDKTFFKFACGFLAIVLLSLFGLYFNGRFESRGVADQAAAVR